MKKIEIKLNFHLIAVLLMFAIFFSNIISAQPVVLDPAFGNNGMTIIHTAGEINRFIYDTSENIIVIGNTTESGYPAIVKTDANGVLDKSFGTN